MKLLFIFLLSSNVFSIENPFKNFEGKRLIGVLDYRHWSGKGRNTLPPGTKIIIKEQPKTDSRTLGEHTLTTYGNLLDPNDPNMEKPKFPLKVVEIGYEERALVAFDKVNDWYQVEIKNPLPRLGWIKEEENIKFQSISDFLKKNRMTYLTGSWDKKLYKTQNLQELVNHKKFFRQTTLGYITIPEKSDGFKTVFKQSNGRKSSMHMIGLYSTPSENADLHITIAHTNANSWVASWEEQLNRESGFPFIYKIPILEMKEDWYRVALSPDFDRLPPQARARFKGKAEEWKPEIRTVWIHKEEVHKPKLFSKKELTSPEHLKSADALYPRDQRPYAYYSTDTLNDINVKEIKIINGKPVAKIELTSGACSFDWEDGQPKIHLQGWVSLFDKKDNLLIWQYSRGC